MILGLAGSIGAVASPFIAGQVADRYFSTERFLAVLLLARRGDQLGRSRRRRRYESWLVLSIAYSVVFMPTLALSNSLAFANLTDPERQFPIVRVFGHDRLDRGELGVPDDLEASRTRRETARRVAPVLGRDRGRLRALVPLRAPKTPPRREGVEPLAFAKALRLLRIPAFAVLVLVSLPISVIHNIYFQQASTFLRSLGLPAGSVGPAMAIGQLSEILVMAGLGWMLKRLGFRAVITIGALAYFVRYLIWSQTGLPVAAARRRVRRCTASATRASSRRRTSTSTAIAPPDVRHSAQTVFGILILGGGPVIGGWLSGVARAEVPQAEGGVDYSQLWLTVSMIGLGARASRSRALFRDRSRR